MLWHRYELDDDGKIVAARIVPPTSQNQASIEHDLFHFVGDNLDLADDELGRAPSRSSATMTRASVCDPLPRSHRRPVVTTASSSSASATRGGVTTASAGGRRSRRGPGSVGGHGRRIGRRGQPADQRLGRPRSGGGRPRGLQWCPAGNDPCLGPRRRDACSRTGGHPALGLAEASRLVVPSSGSPLVSSSSESKRRRRRRPWALAGRRRCGGPGGRCDRVGRVGARSVRGTVRILRAAEPRECTR